MRTAGSCSTGLPGAGDAQGNPEGQTKAWAVNLPFLDELQGAIEAVCLSSSDRGAS